MAVAYTETIPFPVLAPAMVCVGVFCEWAEVAEAHEKASMKELLLGFNRFYETTA